MNSTTISIGIYGALAALHFANWYVIVYRLMFIDFACRPCASRPFRELLEKLRQPGSWPAAKERFELSSDGSWLSACLEGDSYSSIAAVVDDVAKSMDRFMNILHLVSGCSTMLGLLGTVAGFLVAPTMNHIGLNIAFQTTFAGIVVGLPAIVYVGLTQPRRDQVLQQIDELLDTLQQFEFRDVTAGQRLPTLQPHADSVQNPPSIPMVGSHTSKTQKSPRPKASLIKTASSEPLLLTASHVQKAAADELATEPEPYAGGAV